LLKGKRRGRNCFSSGIHRIPSLLYLLVHTETHNIIGRSSLDEGSARRRDLYLTTQTLYKRQTYTSPVGFEPTIPASAWPQTYALDPAATGIDPVEFIQSVNVTIQRHSSDVSLRSPFLPLAGSISLWTYNRDIPGLTTLNVQEYAMEACGGTEVWLHSFLTLALDGCGWWASRPGLVYPRYPPISLSARLSGPDRHSGRLREEKNLPW
jgi:hypothetical protein